VREWEKRFMKRNIASLVCKVSLPWGNVFINACMFYKIMHLLELFFYFFVGVSVSPWSGSLPWKFTKPSGWKFSFSFLVNPYDRFQMFGPQYKEIVSFCSFVSSELQRKSRNLRNLTVQICLIFLEWEYFLQMNIWKIIYLNCRYEYVVDHRSYTQKLSSCEIKAWKRKCSFTYPLSNLNVFQALILQVLGLCV